ncbi:hypothetical protein BJF79_45010 [Actinomadura sp. CNU-125]|nr:hypothetical protein BJF79_45010 [Actinomadura sp. CNU-125]
MPLGRWLSYTLRPSGVKPTRRSGSTPPTLFGTAGPTGSPVSTFQVRTDDRSRSAKRRPSGLNAPRCPSTVAAG